MYRFLWAAMLAVSASGAGWVEYRVGPFRVVSNAGDKPARERLNEMEQLRHVLGGMLGKDTLGVGGPTSNQLEMVWPVEIILFANSKEYGPHALKQPLIEGGSAMLSTWPADTPMSRELLRTITKMLIDQNAGRMPEPMITALCDLFSTIKVSGTKVLIGTPLPEGELTGARLHEWAKIQMLATNPDFTGKLRVYLNNMQGVGDEALAARNAFGLTLARLDEMVDAYVKAGKFEPGPASGAALNPNKDFIEKPLDKETMDSLMAELTGDGKNFPPDSPRGLVAKHNRASLELAAKANPRWGEPYFQMSTLEGDPKAEVADLKTAVKLEPRNYIYWQELAEAQVAYRQFDEAEKSWAAAMQYAPNETERERIHQIRLGLDAKRVAAEKSDADHKAAELEKLKQAAAAEVHAAEDRVNKQLGGMKPGEKPEAWWEDPPGDVVSGSLGRVDCLGNQMIRLTVNIDGGGTIRLLIRDPNHLAVKGTGQAKFGCGIQKPARKIRVIYNLKADAKLDTVGDVAMVDFP